MPTIKIVDDMTNPAPNKLYSHPHVEDYIEIIAGYRLPNGKNNHSIFTIAEPIVSLARYDMKVVPSLAEQTVGGKGYTDRQAQLATQLVLKYERQLFKKGIDVTPVRTPEYRIPLRELDRTSRVWIEDGVIKLRFPYDLKLVDTVRDISKLSQGSFKFNRDKKHHEADLTEWNLNWIHAFSVQHNFEIDQTVHDIMALVIAAEKEPYAITLGYKADGLCITNAESSLVEYIEEKQGGFALENILTLSDLAPVLGYTVDKQIEEDVIASLGTRFWSLCANRQLKVDTMTNSNLVPEVVNYARLTNRFPIYIYEPDLSGRLLTEFNKFFPGAVMTLDNKVMDTNITEDIKIVYTTKIPRTPLAGRIPLMISSAGMLYGGDRQLWIQAAEKVVYFSKDVYNKNTKGQDVCKLD